MRPHDHTRPPLVILAIATIAVALVSPVRSQTPQSGPVTVIGGHEAVAGEVLVKMRPSTQAAQQRARIATEADAAETEALGRSGVHRLRSRRFRTEDLVARLSQDPDVEYAEPNWVLRATVTPNDPSFSNLWGLLNTGANTYGGGGTAGADIDASSAWNITTGTRAVVVGVVDTGIDYNHPDLAPNVWSAPTSFTVNLAGQAITCGAGTHGFNAIARSCDPWDDATTPHGTHVAGTIGAAGNNGTGVVGVNWTTSMMGLKFLGTDGSGATSNAVLAIDFALQAKAIFGGAANVRVLNNSWGGGGYSQALADEITAAGNAGLLFVAAAGNSGVNTDLSPHYPSSYTNSNVLAVAATDNNDALASFSNYGASSVDLAAPGVSIYSTASNNRYMGLSGTSMAAPHVAGAAALMLAACGASTAELRSQLVSTVDLVPSLTGKVSTGGRLNVGRAVSTCPHPNVSSVALAASKTAPQGVGQTITFTATPSGGEAPYQYRWAVWDGSTWTVTAWGTSNTYAWTPAGTNASYKVEARVRSNWNTGAPEAVKSMDFPIYAPIASVGVTSDKPAPQGLGTTITFTATPSGGQPPYQYRWAVWDGTAWTVTPWGAGNTYAWTPASANSSYKVEARARSSWNPGAPEAVRAADFPIYPLVSSVAVSSDKAAPQGLGATITFTATPTGGQPPYQYRWAAWDGSAWTVTPWGTSNVYAWTPVTANSSYKVEARVRGSWNTGTPEAVKATDFAVYPKISSVSLVADKTAPQSTGTPITFTAAAVGGVAPYQYRFAVWDGSAWTVTAWSTSNSFVWTPSTPNAGYKVEGRARSSWNAGTPEAVRALDFPVQ